jgi:hypothetical protein
MMPFGAARESGERTDLSFTLATMLSSWIIKRAVIGQAT